MVPDVPATSGDYAADSATFSAFWKNGAAELGRLPPKPRRNPVEQASAETIKHRGRIARYVFLGAHAPTLYDRLTDNRRKFVRIDRLAYAAAEAVPGLVPMHAEVEREAQLRQGDKEGIEIDQGILCNQFLANPQCGMHLCHAMLMPLEESADALARFEVEGRIDLGTARVERIGKAATLILANQRFLNSEDAGTQLATEIGADVCILDGESQMAVLRGDVIDHGKYTGRRVFNSGINLTHLYHGKIPFLWFLIREMGFVNKIVRGVAYPHVLPDEVSGDSIEKLWIGAVDTFAIGGGCQLMLTMDFNVAANDAYMTLPARKEGIIPGVSNMRLARFVGDRLARQAIMYERRFECDSEDGRKICDEVVPPEDIDTTLVRVIDRIGSAGHVGAIGNRRALRVSLEPLDLFRRYTALYAREQAHCHFSPALIDNLERHWNAQNRAA
ncbi:MAG TPA: enoyl-CoA hydratase/isomerase family protein [Reyranellaceae bacterium]|nr:enoyl-CoA hydratase/isomerase family protein [Reyranellaceae bacterium]